MLRAVAGAAPPAAALGARRWGVAGALAELSIAIFHLRVTLGAAQASPSPLLACRRSNSLDDARPLQGSQDHKRDHALHNHIADDAHGERCRLRAGVAFGAQAFAGATRCRMQLIATLALCGTGRQAR